MRRHKVVQWATGFTGFYALKYALMNPALEVVGVRCFSQAKVGRDAGELCGLEPIGVLATDSDEAIHALDADCVIYTPGMYDMGNPAVPGNNTNAMLESMLPLLASGKNVVSSVCPFIETKHYDGGDTVRARIDSACAEGGSTFFGTGFEPGFMGDVLPLTIASSCGVVTRFTATEVLDYSTYPAFDTLRLMGFACRPEDLAEGVDGISLTWGSVPHMAAAGLGVTLDDVRVEVEIFLAPERFEIAGGTVEQGTIAALLFRLIGVVGGQPRITLQHVNRLRADMAPDWPQVGAAGGYRIEIEGTNPMIASFELGLPGGEGGSFDEAMAMTAARCVHAVDAVVSASPGFKTFLDLPPLTGRYAMHDLQRQS